jgi:hypothetical protein
MIHSAGVVYTLVQLRTWSSVQVKNVAGIALRTVPIRDVSTVQWNKWYADGLMEKMAGGRAVLTDRRRDLSTRACVLKPAERH